MEGARAAAHAARSMSSWLSSWSENVRESSAWANLKDVATRVGESAAAVASNVEEIAEVAVSEGSRFAEKRFLQANVALLEADLLAAKREWGVAAWDAMEGGRMAEVATTFEKAKATVDDLVENIEAKRRLIAELEEPVEDGLVQQPATQRIDLPAESAAEASHSELATNVTPPVEKPSAAESHPAPAGADGTIAAVAAEIAPQGDWVVDEVTGVAVVRRSSLEPDAQAPSAIHAVDDIPLDDAAEGEASPATAGEAPPAGGATDQIDEIDLSAAEAIDEIDLSAAEAIDEIDLSAAEVTDGGDSQGVAAADAVLDAGSTTENGNDGVPRSA